MAQSTKPKIIHVSTTAINLKEMMNGKGFDDVILAFEKLRERYAEQFFLYGFDVKFEVNNWGGCSVTVDRTETPIEVEKRVERNRIATEKRRISVEENKLKKKQQAEDKERKLYEQLKAKFEAV